MIHLVAKANEDMVENPIFNANANVNSNSNTNSTVNNTNAQSNISVEDNFSSLIEIPIIRPRRPRRRRSKKLKNKFIYLFSP